MKCKGMENGGNNAFASKYNLNGGVTHRGIEAHYFLKYNDFSIGTMTSRCTHMCLCGVWSRTYSVLGVCIMS